MNAFQSKFDPMIHRVVANIPSGRVMSYGDIARKAGFPRHSRMVSKAMTRCSYELPWHRVIKSDYTLAFTAGTSTYEKQKALLISEGCQFLNGKVTPAKLEETEDLDKLIWGPE
jgi:methylated-DNA-protein-cysteine methyltransferase-like protein